MTGPLSPRLWGAHLLALVLVAAAAALGWWQVESWQARREAEARDLSQVAPVPLADLIGPDDPFPGQDVGRPVDMSGTWVPDGTVWVTGRELDGRAGAWMVTPLEAAGSGGSAIPVVLGWVPDPADSPPAPTGTADLVAYLQPTEGTGQVDDDPTDDLLPQLRIADVIQHVDQDLYGAYAVSRDGVDGLPAADLAAVPDVGAFTALRNLLYAIEWWVFGAFAAFVWWRWVRDRLALERAGLDPDPDEPDEPERQTAGVSRTG